MLGRMTHYHDRQLGVVFAWQRKNICQVYVRCIGPTTIPCGTNFCVAINCGQASMDKHRNKSTDRSNNEIITLYERYDAL